MNACRLDPRREKIAAIVTDKAVQAVVDFKRTGAKPATDTVFLTPKVITIDNSKSASTPRTLRLLVTVRPAG